MSIEADRKLFEGTKQDKPPVSTLTGVKRTLARTLLREGFVFSECISARPEVPIPGKWLLRSEPAERLRREDYKLVPQSGEHASFGVFLADSFPALPASDNLAFYLFDRDNLANRWLVTGSREWRDRFNRECQEIGANPHTIGGAMSAERRIYEAFPTYDPGRGICTVPNEVPAAAATKIYVPAKLNYLVGQLKPSGCQVSLLSA